MTTFAQVPADDSGGSSSGGAARLFASSQPLYNQPSDADVYQANRAAFGHLKCSLVSYVRRRRQRQESRARAVVESYSEKMAVWMRQIERLESQPVRGGDGRWGEGGRKGDLQSDEIDPSARGPPGKPRTFCRVRDIRTLIGPWPLGGLWSCPGVLTLPLTRRSTEESTEGRQEPGLL